MQTRVSLGGHAGLPAPQWRFGTRAACLCAPLPPCDGVMSRVMLAHWDVSCGWCRVGGLALVLRARGRPLCCVHNPRDAGTLT